MDKAIFELRSGRRAGIALLGRHGEVRGTVAQQVVDGDTVSAELFGDVGVRFLGVDAAESKFPLPGRESFTATDSQDWVDYLTDPFADAPEYADALGSALVSHLRSQLGDDAALNHNRHAKAAEDALEDLIEADMEVLSEDHTSFKFFLSFANEVMDPFGRLLGFINRNQPDPNLPAPRPLSYNERLLGVGRVAPYFIWPNVNPFRRQRSLTEAVPDPRAIAPIANGEQELGPVRRMVKAAREQGLGIFSVGDPLLLLPFELRFLGRGETPSRWVIALTGSNGRLLQPTSYHLIPNPEDRLFVPAEYVPLFVEQGWKRG